MPVRISFLDPAKPDLTQTVTLGGVQYRLRRYWRERLQAWYMDLREIDDTAVVLGRRITPGSDPLAGQEPDNKPAGTFYVMGPDTYRQADLGASLSMLFFATSEIPEAATDDLGLTTT